MVRVDGSSGGGSLISVRGLDKSYMRGGEEIHVLQGLNLDVGAGEFVAFMGPSGSGKTTLLNLLGGLDVPTRRHRSRVAGDEITATVAPQAHGLARAARRLRVPGLQPDPGALRLPERRAAAAADAALARPSGASTSRPRSRIVGLQDRMHHFPRQLSGGQEQRVAIARAIVADPTFLLCDEPTGDLDRKSADEVLDLLRCSSREHGKTILMVTHDPRAAERASALLHLDKGVLVEAAPSGLAMVAS